MFRPYTDDFPATFAIAGQCVAASLTAVLFARPLRSKPATALFVAGVWVAALFPPTLGLRDLLNLHPPPSLFLALQTSASLVTLAMVLNGKRWLSILAVVGQWVLVYLTSYLRDADYELAQAHLIWYGALAGLHLLSSAEGPGAYPSLRRRSFAIQDAVIFCCTVGLAFYVTDRIFQRVTFNGDEIANTFQANVYSHFQAYAPIPPCGSMFENYWVFRYQGRAFSQYPPGWPLFMAPFDRLGMIYLAGPTMAGIVAVGVARLSRRVASGLAPTEALASRIVAIAGPLGAISAMFGPSMLLNGASRFSHPMVAACFAWAVESAAVVSEPGISRRRALAYGALLGVATSLGLSTRPGDGGTLGVGVFLYVAYAFARRRLRFQAVLGTALGFLCMGGLAAVILRLQLGGWFKTAYSIAASIHPEAEVKLSWPNPHEFKYMLPLAWGSYTWWPASAALGAAGLVRALRGRERRVSFMLIVSGLVFVTFYLFPEFSRVSDDGLGPRYHLPMVVPMAVGGAALLSPLFAALYGALRERPLLRTKIVLAAVPVALVTVAMTYGTYRIAPHVYPLAKLDYQVAAAHLRTARDKKLKRAIVILEQARVPAHVTNLAQNLPFDPDPDVLFLIKRSSADETCAKKHYPGRKWYRAGPNGSLERYTPK
jgi:hypothetical protein